MAGAELRRPARFGCALRDVPPHPVLRNQPERQVALTTGERSALQWLTAVAVLGAGGQLYRHWRYSGDATPLSTEALSRQLVAVDSAQRAGRQLARGRRAPAASVRRRALGSAVDEEAVGERRGPADAAPSPRRTSRASARRDAPTLGPVDLDRADSATLERLPRIGPALAARIVSDRSAKGPYGSLDGLQRVRGIGPKLAKGLETLVTFSGTPRPSPVQR